MEPVVVLFDGYCVLCNRFADFILRHDARKSFVLGALQSQSGQEWLKRAGMPSDFAESVVVIDGERAYTGATAALRIVRGLGFPWRLATVLSLVPPPLREAMYAWIARNRYSWFGKRASCRLPSESEQDRFLR